MSPDDLYLSLIPKVLFTNRQYAILISLCSLCLRGCCCCWSYWYVTHLSSSDYLVSESRRPISTVLLRLPHLHSLHSAMDSIHSPTTPRERSSTNNHISGLTERQTQAQPAAEAAAMSNAAGEVVSFDSTAVYLGKQPPGLNYARGRNANIG